MPEEGSQYVMIISDEVTFDELQNCPEIAAVRANATLVFLNPEQMAFKKEVLLGSDEDYISFI